jgi:hypothetical protein
VDQLALSPQYGFASGMEGNLLTEDQQWRKLELVVQTARKCVGGRLIALLQGEQGIRGLDAADGCLQRNFTGAEVRWNRQVDLV